MQRLEGDGLCFVHAGGTVHPLDLQPGQTLRVDTGCLVALQPTVGYDIQFVGKIKTALFGGEGLFFATLTGPGRVWLQSLPFSRMADRIYKAAPAAGGKRVGRRLDPRRPRRPSRRRQLIMLRAQGSALRTRARASAFRHTAMGRHA